MTCANGNRRPGRHLLRIVVGFDEETFDQIKRMAEADRCSMGEKIRQLCEWGMMNMEEEDG